MSCMIANLQGGRPEIFPIDVDSLRALQEIGLQTMQAALATRQAAGPEVHQYAGVALRPDGAPFYLTTVAPAYSLKMTRAPWHGAFFAPFGVGDVHGEVYSEPDGKMVVLKVAARLMVRGAEHAAASWEVLGTQVTAPNKSSLIRAVSVATPGPHDPADMRRCIALHAPEKVFGEPRAIVAMQCGVAVAALLEAIC